MGLLPVFTKTPRGVVFRHVWRPYQSVMVINPEKGSTIILNNKGQRMREGFNEMIKFPDNKTLKIVHFYNEKHAPQSILKIGEEKSSTKERRPIDSYMGIIMDKTKSLYIPEDEGLLTTYPKSIIVSINGHSIERTSTFSVENTWEVMVEPNGDIYVTAIAKNPKKRQYALSLLLEILQPNGTYKRIAYTLYIYPKFVPGINPSIRLHSSNPSPTENPSPTSPSLTVPDVPNVNVPSKKYSPTHSKKLLELLTLTPNKPNPLTHVYSHATKLPKHNITSNSKPNLTVRTGTYFPLKYDFIPLFTVQSKQFTYASPSLPSPSSPSPSSQHKPTQSTVQTKGIRPTTPIQEGITPANFEPYGTFSAITTPFQNPLIHATDSHHVLIYSLEDTHTITINISLNEYTLYTYGTQIFMFRKENKVSYTETNSVLSKKKADTHFSIDTHIITLVDKPLFPLNLFIHVLTLHPIRIHTSKQPNEMRITLTKSGYYEQFIVYIQKGSDDWLQKILKILTYLTQPEKISEIPPKPDSKQTSMKAEFDQK